MALRSSGFTREASSNRDPSKAASRSVGTRRHFALKLPKTRPRVTRQKKVEVGIRVVDGLLFEEGGHRFRYGFCRLRGSKAVSVQRCLRSRLCGPIGRRRTRSGIGGEKAEAPAAPQVALLSLIHPLVSPLLEMQTHSIG
jgi:hypothetical protein